MKKKPQILLLVAPETSASTIDDIGAAVGYEDPTSFRRVFKRNVDLSPANYRKKFQRIAQIS